jgi:nitroreductase
LTYGLSVLWPFKWILFNLVGIFRPIVRGPVTFNDLQMVSIKSVALACENFMLAISAQGFSSCPMEGIDECRVKRLLKLALGTRVAMVIAVGEGDGERGTWGPQVRFERSWFVKKV